MDDTEKALTADLDILVVDDESFMLKLVTRILSKLGGENITTASSGEEALELVESMPRHPDIILTDLNMPGMDGIELIRHIAEKGFKGGIIFFSGEDERVLTTVGDLARAHDLDVLGTLAKPVTPPALEALLRKFELVKTAGTRGAFSQLPLEELKAGIQSDQLVVFYQPKVSVQTRQLLGVEALVRWQHPEHGLMGPGAFVPMAEEAGLIDELTDEVFVKAMKQGGIWRKQGHDLKVSVNVSVDSLVRLDLPEWVVKNAAEHGMDPANVVLEVTETKLMADLKKPLEILTRLRIKGISLSIDDFGTGHSSMEQLKRIPFTELKVDRAFVFGACNDPATRAILESSVTLGKSLNMTIVAEGAETREDWDLVKSLGVDLVQGYFVAKPMPGPELIDWYNTWAASDL